MYSLNKVATKEICPDDISTNKATVTLYQKIINLI